MLEPKWKRFERLVYDIQKDLADGAEVTLDDKIKGEDSKTSRQIDISVRQQVSQFSLLVVIDCKDYKHPVDVKDIGEFVTTIRDVRANKGAMVSSSGFTEAALALAKHHAIDTFRLVDTETQDWKTYVSVPALLERSFISRFRFRLRPSTAVDKPDLLGDPKLFRVFNSDGSFLGLAIDLIADKWNKQQINNEPGEYDISLATDVTIETTATRFNGGIEAKIIVDRQYYFGQLPINTRGLQNEQDGGFITREFTTANVSPSQIERGLEPGWSRIEDPQQLAVKPIITMMFADALPRSTDAN